MSNYILHIVLIATSIILYKTDNIEITLEIYSLNYGDKIEK